jgi:anthranilate phosphoribosyltransferase
MVKEAIQQTAKTENLTYKTAEAIMHEIMEGRASENIDVRLFDSRG